MLAEGAVLDRPALFLNTPSVLDPTLAPDGRHVFSLECLYTPYRFAPGWADRAEPLRWLDLAADVYEDGFAESVLDWRAVTPDVYEREFHLPSGHADSFAGGPLAALAQHAPRADEVRDQRRRVSTSRARQRFPAPASGVRVGAIARRSILDAVGRTKTLTRRAPRWRGR